jgi:hypothetical protein
MRILTFFSLFLLLLPMMANAQDEYGCQQESLEIREKASDGSTLRLEFGSLWAIERAEWADTRIWLRLERVHICKDGLRKEGSQHVVRAKRIER